MSFPLFEWLFDPSAWVALITLTVLEIVLGIDNVIFISLLVQRLGKQAAKRARQIGLGLALIFRIALLFVLTWIIALKEPVFTLFGHGFSWRDIVLFAGGVFLIVKSVQELHKEVEGAHGAAKPSVASGAFWTIIFQIILIDLVFSIDSIITAIGLAEDIEIMVIAVLIAVVIMYAASGWISDFISRHPTTKVLALAFLLLIGIALVADGLGFKIPRGYIYFSMAFAGLVEGINIASRKNTRKAKAAAPAKSARAKTKKRTKKK
ncbi:MAG: TerC family protein [Xanthobacteraceae bacterium]|nr:TerC family protein [Xanthobacteraceae bacterium]MBX3533883.1 TerC family protein [Xanthobacteraceae bacterium]MBX3547701.1 TerC family protein [Xanthobacteraceae bacterium]MCW5674842.1 TerC family protein [Xanthobacteraceae bacterium]MCW5677191.1 TerC family protein [Xanthobacteraceae bacterium]